MWTGCNLGKHKFFFWLLIKDRLNTRNLLRRKHMHLDDYNCAICNASIEETSMHLFFECPFSLSCWSSIGIIWDLSLPPLDMIIEARTNFGSSIFREIVIAACWAIWNSRNGLIFDNKPCNLSNWKAFLKEEIGLICIKAKPNLEGALWQWLENIA